MSTEKNRMKKLAGILLNEAKEIETINTTKKGDYIVKKKTNWRRIRSYSREV